jgi:hypothetical protein
MYDTDLSGINIRNNTLLDEKSSVAHSRTKRTQCAHLGFGKPFSPIVC